MIPQRIITLIETWRLGFVATADASGCPNLSPKGTFVVLTPASIGFAEMRSPRTMANLRVRKDVDVNFVDVLSRRGASLCGTASIIDRSDAEFAGLLPAFLTHWPDLETMFNAIVTIDVTECRPILSPAYEAGASEADLRATWASRIAELALDGDPA